MIIQGQVTPLVLQPTDHFSIYILYTLVLINTAILLYRLLILCSFIALKTYPQYTHTSNIQDKAQYEPDFSLANLRFQKLQTTKHNVINYHPYKQKERKEIAYKIGERQNYPLPPLFSEC